MSERAKRARFRQVKILFEVLSELPEERRDEALRDLCPDDPDMRSQVTHLLEFGDEDGAVILPWEGSKMGDTSTRDADPFRRFRDD